MAKLTKEERQALAGIPESRPFIDPETANEESPLLDLHVGGTLVRDMAGVMGPGWLSKLSYHHTDEAIAERNAGKKESVARVVASSEFEKRLAQWEDSAESDMQPWEAPNPMTALERQYVRPGFKPRWMAPTAVDKRAKGLRGWKPVRDADGDLVKLGTLFLAEMPEERAEQRNEHYRAMGAANLQRSQEKQQEEHERAVRDTRGGFAPMSSGEFTGRVAVGMSENDARDYRGTTPTATLGLRQSRGNSLTE